jgi:double-strand break repair protein MRE11
MLRPRERQNEWFNLLVLHQNRAQHGSATNCIPEQFLDDFLDLIIWGHEHECLIDPMENVTKNFFVTQPGSTIATSLSEGETREKHCALLLIHEKNFKIKKIRLETVRQFYMDEIVLSETKISPGDPDATRKVETYCTEKVQQLLDRAGRAVVCSE